MQYKYLLDTGVLSRYLAKTIKLPDEVILYACVSVVTKIELYNWLSIHKEADKSERARILRSIKKSKGYPNQRKYF